jgi:hypothetical protein
LQKYWSLLQDHFEITPGTEISDYLAIDNEVLTSGALTLAEIAQTCSSSNADEADSDSDKEIVVEEQVPITGSDARQAFI